MSKLPDESFRDSIGTITKEGKRNFIFPKKPSGKFFDRRKIVSYILLVFLLSAPFIKINGNQFLLFNVLERKFSIFGLPFWPQDFYLFVMSMIIGVVGLTLFTVAFGRIFCGWFCPQTIFLEMVFRRIEYWIDGLNDSGALAQSNVGISISENVNVFSPACDGILDASQFDKIDFYMNYSKNAMKTIYMSFGLSLLYNFVGLSFAISGNLSPLVAAIIMPLSTITIVSFVTIMSNIYANKK